MDLMDLTVETLDNLYYFAKNKASLHHWEIEEGAAAFLRKQGYYVAADIDAFKDLAHEHMEDLGLQEVE